MDLRRQGLAAEPCQQQVDRELTDPVDVRVDGRQPRDDASAAVRVVEPDDRLVPRQHQAARPQRPQEPDRVAVGRGDRRRGRCARGQEADGRVGTTLLEVVGRLVVPLRVGPQAVLGQDVAVGLVPFPHVTLDRVAHERDTGVPVVQQVLHRRPHATGVVGDDQGGGQRGLVLADQHDRPAPLLHRREPVVPDGLGDHDDPVHGAERDRDVQQRLVRVALTVQTRGVGLDRHHAMPRRPGRTGDAGDQCAEVEAAHDRRQHPDRASCPWGDRAASDGRHRHSSPTSLEPRRCARAHRRTH